MNLKSQAVRLAVSSVACAARASLLLPLINSRRIELLDDPRLINQLCDAPGDTAAIVGISPGTRSSLSHCMGLAFRGADRNDAEI
jgi:hypothetical protein